MGFKVGDLKRMKGKWKMCVNSQSAHRLGLKVFLWCKNCASSLTGWYDDVTLS